MITNPVGEAAPVDWELTTLGEACKRSGGGVQTGPFGSQLHASDYVQSGVPVIMPENIGSNRVLEADIARISYADARRLARYRVRPGDIVFSRRGDVGRRTLIRAEQDGWLCGTGCLRVRFGGAEVDPAFASYYCGHPGVRDWLARHAQGATMPNLNTTILEDLPLLIPPQHEQRAIAEVLGTLDAKVEQARRMNDILDELLTAEFERRFSALGETPTTTALSELMELHRVPIQPFAAARDVFDHYSIPAFDNGKQPQRQRGGEIRSSKFAVPDGAVLVSKLNPAIPRVWLPLPARPPAARIASTEFMVLTPRSPASTEFLYCLWRSRLLRDALTARASGSTGSHQRVRPQDVLSVGVRMPVGVDCFTEFARPLCSRLIANLRQIELLAAVRDVLLPVIVSGEVRMLGSARVAGTRDPLQ